MIITLSRCISTNDISTQVCPTILFYLVATSLRSFSFINNHLEILSFLDHFDMKEKKLWSQ